MQLSFGGRIKAARISQNLSVEKLASLANLTRVAIYRLESGLIFPALNSVVQIAIALNVTIDYLLYGNDKESIKTTPLLPYTLTHLNKLSQE